MKAKARSKNKPNGLKFTHILNVPNLGHSIMKLFCNLQGMVLIDFLMKLKKNQFREKNHMLSRVIAYTFSTPIKKHLQILLRKCLIIKSPLPGSNQRPTDYKSVALPAELRRLISFIKLSISSAGACPAGWRLTKMIHRIIYLRSALSWAKEAFASLSGLQLS